MAITPNPAQASALAWFKQQLTAWGIPQLVPDAQKLVMQGLDNDAITLQLQDTDAYKKRFAGNALRIKAGLSVLSPAEYVATETTYASILRQYGLPKGFYDSHDDFTKWIAADVSPTELNQRASDAQEKYMLGPAENRSWWRDVYGGTDAEAVAAILDPTRALPIMESRLRASAIGGAALSQQLNVNRARAEEIAALGVTGDQAQAGYADIAYALPTESNIAQRFGEDVGQNELEAAKFNTADAAEAQRKLRLVNQSEVGLFAGKSGADSKSLSRSTTGSY